MQNSKASDFLDLGSTVSRSRSTSLSSDSQLPRINLLSPPAVNPQPAFIASSAASQIITTDQEFNTVDLVADDENNVANESAVVTPAALLLLNSFLDHLLYNILAASKSTQLTCIRPAVAEVLKPRLAKEVVSAADDELSEYMGGAEDEELDFRGGQEPGGEFDLIRSWKLTRLRCMVYTRLGDMEEEDEDEYIAQDGLGESEGAPPRFTSHVGNITPAAAIFLTSIIEHLGEQALIIAGETARTRLSARLAEIHDEGRESAVERNTRLVVEDIDMEKLALNATLGRLWRTWRKRMRTPTLSRTLSRESFRRRGYAASIGRKDSLVTFDEPLTDSPRSPGVEVSDQVDPASVPLPMTEHDVQEIEIPGFSGDIEGEIVTMKAIVAHKVRPRSLMVSSSPSPTLRSPSSNTSSPITPLTAKVPKAVRHARSKSMPSGAMPLDPNSPVVDQENGQSAVTPSEERKQLETMYEYEEQIETDQPEIGVAVSPAQPASDMPGAQVSTDQDTESSPEEKRVSATAPDAVAEVSQQVAAVEIVTSQSSSGDASEASLSDRQEQETEIIEGQGMCEKPKLSSGQRPRRKSSKDTPRKDLGSTLTLQTNDSPMQAVDEDQPPTTQGAAEAEAAAAINHEVVQSSDATISIEKSSVSQTLAGDAVPDQTASQGSMDVSEGTPATETTMHDFPQSSENRARTSISDDSDRSQRSRPPSRPNPSTVTIPSQQSYGRTSPATSIATERAGVQRIPARPSTAASSNYSKPRRSDSFSSSREKRPVTAGSTTSQVSSKLKGLIGRPHGEPASPRLRSSSETSRVSAGSGDSADNDKATFNKLIKSDETIHFTLTPKGMREMEEPDSPRWNPPRSNTSDLAEFLKNTAPPGEQLPRPRTSNVSSRGTLDLPSISKSRSIESAKYKALEKASMDSSRRLKAGQAREARPVIESTRDFAQFIKSTGPNPSADAPGSGMPPHQRRASESQETPKKPGRRASLLSRASSRMAGPRLQARSAASGQGQQTSELIDFIREGPPTMGAHRIPRTVAPFRDTMDSDDLQSFEPGKKDPTRSSLASTPDGSLSSRTALLKSASRETVQTGLVKQAPAPFGGAAMDDDPRPVRKQRRVRDPYAIDSDDDDELEELLENPKPKREEESLIDFLRNAPPPPEPATAPQRFAVNVPTSKASSFASASAMKARLLRNTSLEKVPTSKASRSSLRSQAESYVGGQSNYAVKVGMERSGGMVHVSNGPATAAPFAHRPTETSSLADFLRNTGPPEPPASRTSSAMSGSMREAATGSISRFLMRRKKVEA